MLHECMQGRFSKKKHSKLRELEWKNLTKLACNMQNFEKNFMQNICTPYQKLLSQFCYTLLSPEESSNSSSLLALHKQSQLKALWCVY